MDRYELAALCETVPGTVSVTFESWESDGGFAAGVTVLYAEERPVDASDQGDGDYSDEVESTIWKLSTKYLTAYQPKMGDKITDAAGKVWFVKTWKWELMRSVYRCFCTAKP